MNISERVEKICITLKHQRIMLYERNNEIPKMSLRKLRKYDG